LTEQNTSRPTLPANVRVMIALTASPTLIVVGMLLYTLFFDGWRSISISMIIFSMLCILAYYVVISGHPPRFTTKKRD
jgi:purine-cytosine permease-like protein